MKVTGKQAFCLALGSLCAPAFAQSSVQIYGLLDAGISWVSNQGGHSVTKFDDGINGPTFIGLRGNDDLGGGVRALFVLESQFQIGLGSNIPGQGIFGRQAYVGLSSDSLGTLTLGNQFDFMYDSFARGSNESGILAGGLYNFRSGPFQSLGLPSRNPNGAGNPSGSTDWDRGADEQVFNAVKYQSPSFHGISFGLLYGLGGVPGAFSAGSTFSATVTYAAGPVGLAAAYTGVRYQGQTSADINPFRTWGVGGHYDFGAVTMAALFTTTRNVNSGASVYAAQIGANWIIVPDVTLGGTYLYMKGNNELNNVHANQVGATLSYLLSKRSLVYVQGVYQRGSHGSNAQINGVQLPAELGASTSSNQGIARIGVRTLF
ncbi:porin [Burkholderia anthina]|uniref:porin n=1 Tax=Burkholderia anthina TaxID=179879 RepID=UPI00158D25A1|nr:porin [Burkholderia anthina]MBY4869697.1 porin [Burkholderia anthina]